MNRLAFVYNPKQIKEMNKNIFKLKFGNDVMFLNKNGVDLEKKTNEFSQFMLNLV